MWNIFNNNWSFGNFIVNSEQISHVFLVFLLLTSNNKTQKVSNKVNNKDKKNNSKINNKGTQHDVNDV